MSALSETDSVSDEVTTELKSNKLTKGTTVRLSRAADEVVREFVKEYRISYAEIVRLAVENRLEKYLGSVKYIDRKQAETINNNIAKLGNIMIDIKRELRHIGNNYNQQVKAMNDEKKRREARSKGSLFTFDWNLEDDNKSKKSALNNIDLPLDAIEKLIERYEIATKELGDKIWAGHM